MPAVTPTKRPSRAERGSAETAACPQAPAPGGMLTSALAIPGLPEHVPAVRAFTSLVLGVHGIDDDGVAGLLVTELAANSLQHSESGRTGGTITVTVTVTPEKVRAEVADDGGDGTPALRAPAGAEAERGRGLLLVEELADDWGWSGGRGQLVTWFELKTGTPS